MPAQEYPQLGRAGSGQQHTDTAQMQSMSQMGEQLFSHTGHMASLAGMPRAPWALMRFKACQDVETRGGMREQREDVAAAGRGAEESARSAVGSTHLEHTAEGGGRSRAAAQDEGEGGSVHGSKRRRRGCTSEPAAGAAGAANAANAANAAEAGAAGAAAHVGEGAAESGGRGRARGRARKRGRADATAGDDSAGTPTVGASTHTASTATHSVLAQGGGDAGTCTEASHGAKGDGEEPEQQQAQCKRKGRKKQPGGSCAGDGGGGGAQGQVGGHKEQQLGKQQSDGQQSKKQGHHNDGGGDEQGTGQQGVKQGEHAGSLQGAEQEGERKKGKSNNNSKETQRASAGGGQKGGGQRRSKKGGSSAADGLHDYGTRAGGGGELCRSCEELGPHELLEHLRQLSWYNGQIVHTEHVPARDARFGTPSLPLSDSTITALAAKGVPQLFVHQARAVDAVRRGAHCAVSTATASGKSLCYNIPILEALAMDPSSCALYCFPTKALAQDQLMTLRGLVATAFGSSAPAVEIYDGDTPQNDRPAIRDRAQLLITNPDMMHRSILPFHAQFARLLGHLRVVVVDEGHAYHGVFGAHTAMVLRRLRRVCAGSYGTYPRFVVTSATTANPAQHAARLIGLNDATATAATAAAAAEQSGASGQESTGVGGVGGTGLQPAAQHASRRGELNNEAFLDAELGTDLQARQRPWWLDDCDGKTEELVLVTEDGAPGPGRLFVLWNPPLKAARKMQQGQQGTRKQDTASTGPAQESFSTKPLGVRAARTAARRMLREANAARCRGTRLGGQQVEVVEGSASFETPEAAAAAEAEGESAGGDAGQGEGQHVAGKGLRVPKQEGEGVGCSDRAGASTRGSDVNAEGKEWEDRQQRPQAAEGGHAHSRGCVHAKQAQQLAQRHQKQQEAWAADAVLGLSVAALRRKVFGLFGSPSKELTHPTTAQSVAHAAGFKRGRDSLSPNQLDGSSAKNQPDGLSAAQAGRPGAAQGGGAAAAAQPCGPGTVGGDGLLKQRQQQRQQQQHCSDDDEVVVLDADTTQQQQQQQQQSKVDDEVVVLDDGTVQQQLLHQQQKEPSQAPKKPRLDPARAREQQRREQQLLRNALAAISSVQTLADPKMPAWCGSAQGQAFASQQSQQPKSQHPQQEQLHPSQQLDLRPIIHLKQPGLVALPDEVVLPKQEEEADPVGPGMVTERVGHVQPAESTHNKPVPGSQGQQQRQRQQQQQRQHQQQRVSRAEHEQALTPAGVAARLPRAGEWKALYGAAGTPEDERRDSPIVEVALLLAEFMQHGLKTLAFCKTRKLSELVAAYTRETLKATAPHLTERLKVYRGGYSPEDRRAVEAGLHSGDLLGVTATNALELGIDVGALDGTLHLGFPGSIASLKQQAGRAGRRGRPSLSILVSFDGPLEQHFMRHPEELFGRPIESAQVDVRNPRILASHLVCAAAEMPLDCSAAVTPAAESRQLTISGARDASLFGAEYLQAVAQTLLNMGLLGRHPHFTSAQGAWLLHYAGAKELPAADVTLRAIDDQGIDIVLEGTKQIIERVELSKAFFEVYDGAVMLWQSKTYLCKSLDLTSMVAVVKPADLKYYTKVRDYTDIHVTGGRVAYHTSAALQSQALTQSTGSQSHHHHHNHQQQQCCEALSGAAAGTGGGGGGGGNQAAGAATGTADQSQGGAASLGAVLAADTARAGTANPGHVHAADAAGAMSQKSSLPAAVRCPVPQCEHAVVTQRFLGFFRVWQGTGRVFDSVDLWLPDVRFDTQASYIRVPPSARHGCMELGLDFRAALHAASHAVLNVLPAFVTMDARDVGTECDNPYDTRYRPERIIIYDNQAGGIGIAQMAAPLFPQLLQRALALVQECPCAEAKGCPTCCQYMHCRNYNAVLDKQGALVVLRHCLGLS